MKKKVYFQINLSDIKKLLVSFAKSHIIQGKQNFKQLLKLPILDSKGDIQVIGFIKEKLLRDKINFKTKIIDIKEKVTSIDIQVEWKEIGECILLSIFTIFLYNTILLAEFSFIPMVIVAIKRGWKESFIYLTWSMIILSFLSIKGITLYDFNDQLVLFSPLHYGFRYIGNALGFSGRGVLDYYFMYGVFGIFLGYLIRKNYRLGYIISLSVLSYIGMIALVFLIAGFIDGFKSFISSYYRFVDEATNNYIATSLAQINNYSDILSSRGISSIALKKKIVLIAEMYKKSIIFGAAPKGGYIIKQIIMVFAAVFLVRLYFRNRLNKAALKFRITDFDIDNIWIWGLIFSWGLVYINLFFDNFIFSIFAWNSAVIFSFLFFLRGLSILKLANDRLGIPQFVQYIVFLLMMIYSFVLFIIFITGIGVIDVWLYLKDKLQKSSEEKD